MYLLYINWLDKADSVNPKNLLQAHALRHPEVRWLLLLLLLDAVIYDLQDLLQYDAGFSYKKVKTDSLKVEVKLLFWKEWKNPVRVREEGKGRGPNKNANQKLIYKYKD